MGDEDKAFAIVQPARRAANRVYYFFSRIGNGCSTVLTFSHLLLQHIAAIMLGFRGFDMELGAPRELIQPGENGFELFCRQEVVKSSASCRHQEENTPEHDVLAFNQVGDLLKI